MSHEDHRARRGHGLGQIVDHPSDLVGADDPLPKIDFVRPMNQEAEVEYEYLYYESNPHDETIQHNQRLQNLT